MTNEGGGIEGGICFVMHPFLFSNRFPFTQFWTVSKAAIWQPYHLNTIIYSVRYSLFDTFLPRWSKKVCISEAR